MKPIARITGSPANGYLSELWSGMGSLLLNERHITAQAAHDAINAVVHGAEIHWFVVSL